MNKPQKVAGNTLVHKNEFKSVLRTEFGDGQHSRGIITVGVGTTHSSTPFMMGIETKREDNGEPQYTEVALTPFELEEIGTNLGVLMQAFHATKAIDERATELRKQMQTPMPPMGPHPADRSHGLQMVERDLE
jgi:hypothetical protein